MFKKPFFMIATALFLQGCATGGEMLPSGPPGTPYVLTPTNTEAIKKAVTQGFNDPAAAQFQNLRAAKKDIKVAVCGEVNGKNKFGAYVGFVPFSAFLDPVQNIAGLGKIGSSADSYSNEAAWKECQAEGM